MTLDISLVPSCSSRHLVNDIDDDECLHLVPDAGEMAAVATTTVHVEAMQEPSPRAAVCVLLNTQHASVVSARRTSCTGVRFQEKVLVTSRTFPPDKPNPTLTLR